MVTLKPASPASFYAPSTTHASPHWQVKLDDIHTKARVIQAILARQDALNGTAGSRCWDRGGGAEAAAEWLHDLYTYVQYPYKHLPFDAAYGGRSNADTKPLCREEAPRELHVFRKQAEAFQFVQDAAQREPLHIFSYQDPTSGVRKYMAASYEAFWRAYVACKPDERHYYEVIPENTPCKLYFDIEYMFDANPDLPSEDMIEDFKQYVVMRMNDIFGSKIDMNDFVDLDSTSGSKFSRHLVLHKPGLLFKNNHHIGLFVRRIIDEMHQVWPSFNSLLVQKSLEDHSRRIFVDEGVYTKNRTFRLYLSSKAGSSAILKAHHTDAHYDAYLADLVSLGSKPRPSEQALLEFEYFLKTLICSSPFDTDTRLLTMPDGEPLKKTPYCPKAPSGLASSLPAHLTGEKATISRESPFPRIDAYIASIIQTSLSSPSVDPNWKPGYIRSVSFYPQGRMIVYEIGANRYCDRIGRAHKSNHVRIVVSLMDKTWIRVCLDAECKRMPFSPSMIHSLPDSLLVSDHSSGDPQRLDADDDDFLTFDDISTIPDI